MNNADRWNHNIHYHPLLLAAVRPGSRVLDVGCGEGTLTRAAAQTAAHVIGIDLHATSIELARTTTAETNVEYVCGDVFKTTLAPESFDAVLSVATLHHLGAEAGLLRLREWVRPGGTLGVIGLAASEYPRDLPWEVGGAISTRLHKLNKRYWEHSAPTLWPPPETYRQVRRIAEQLLPGVQFRRHLLWRYSLIWQRPQAQ